MLPDSLRLKKQLGVMYFEIVLFASLRCINDISLMNFSILPRGDLYMLQCCLQLPIGLLMFRLFVVNLIVSILFFSLPNSVR